MPFCDGERLPPPEVVAIQCVEDPIDEGVVFGRVDRPTVLVMVVFGRNTQDAEKLRVPIYVGRSVLTPGCVSILTARALERATGDHFDIEPARIGRRLQGVARVVDLGGAERDDRPVDDLRVDEWAVGCDADDFERYLRELRPSEVDQSLRFYRESLNRMTMHDLRAAIDDAGLELCALVPWYDRRLAGQLNPDILLEVQRTYPTAAVDDLLATFVTVVARRPA